MPETSQDAPLLEVRNLSKHYEPRAGLFSRGKGRVVRAVDDVSFTLHRGETIGLVGESGCGKSSIARTILLLEQPTAGQVLYRGRNIYDMGTEELRTLRRRMQVIFQDPYSALNPRMTVEQIISEVWDIHRDLLPKGERPERVRELLVSVGLRREHAERNPHQFSGGQLQRVGIARAMALEPEILICDEPVSALDLSVQAQVVNLLEEIQARMGVAYIFIAHDLSIVRHLSDRIAVMYLGRMAELGDAAEVYRSPRHPYTRALLSAEPNLGFGEEEETRQRIELEGEVPSPANPPSGCRFRTRCWKAQAKCAEVMPELERQKDSASQRAACHFPEPAQGASAANAAPRRNSFPSG